MEKIYSKINDRQLLHITFMKNDFSKRQDLIDPLEFIQLASIELKKDQTFKPHKHKWKKTTFKQFIAQESWVIINGSVKVDYYDLDDSLLKSVILNDGDCTVTLRGGHNYTSLEENTLVYEFKTGPYFGLELDKEPLNIK